VKTRGCLLDRRSRCLLVLAVASILVAGASTTASAAPDSHPTVTRMEFPLSFVSDDPCAGEAVAYTGVQTLMFVSHTDASGGSHAVFLLGLDLIGIGLESGSTYRLRGLSREIELVDTPDYTERAELDILGTADTVVSQGPRSNTVFRWVLTQLITPTGDFPRGSGESQLLFLECVGAGA
jgi:hypothetical protein